MTKEWLCFDVREKDVRSAFAQVDQTLHDEGRCSLPCLVCEEEKKGE